MNLTIIRMSSHSCDKKKEFLNNITLLQEGVLKRKGCETA
jgi:hypothetical protein